MLLLFCVCSVYNAVTQLKYYYYYYTIATTTTTTTDNNCISNIMIMIIIILIVVVIITIQESDAEALNYAALKFSKQKTEAEKRNTVISECVYTEVHKTVR